MRRICPYLLLITVLSTVALGRDPSGIAGEVKDTSGHVLTGTEILIQSEATGARWRTRVDIDGHYSVSGLAPGRYKVTARLAGFRTVSRVGAVAESGQTLRFDFGMEMLGLHEVINVPDVRDPLATAAAPSLLLTRDSPGGTLPTSGGDIRVLFDLMPGVVVTPAATSDAGQFTSGGQRPNANAFRIDGISANTGVGGSTFPGAFPGASLPAMTAYGSTESLVSNESAQSVELRTSDFSPEYSGRLGAESLVTTRAGTNAFHADLFGKWRDEGWSARDWFSNSYDPALPRPFYLRRGAVFSGPIWRNYTFFLLSAEFSEITGKSVQLTSVPSMDARNNAPDSFKLLLNQFPLPTGPDLGAGEAIGVTEADRKAQLLGVALRVDQSLGRRGTLFVRLNDAPSSAETYRFNWASGTIGLTTGVTSHSFHDLRFNFSRSDLLTSPYGQGPASPNFFFGIAGLLPYYEFLRDGSSILIWPTADPTSIFSSARYVQKFFALSVPGLGQFVDGGSGTARQSQREARESYAHTLGRHELRAGFDYIQLAPSRDYPTDTVLGVASSLQSLIQNEPIAVTLSSLSRNGATVREMSAFVQDSYRVNTNLSLMFGLNWDITPPTTKAQPNPTVSGLWTGTTLEALRTTDVAHNAPWPMRFGQFSPRFGAAYRVPGSPLVLRAGAGLFRDSSLGATLNPINGAPFNSWLQNGSGRIFGPPPTVDNSASPDVQQFLNGGAYPALRLPSSYQWRLSAERQLENRGVASLAYVGALGRNLLGNQTYLDPQTGAVARTVTLTENSSRYESLQARYSGAITRNLFASASYTWSHSIDDGSLDSSAFLIHPHYRLTEATGSSNFDVRHAFTLALSHKLVRANLPLWLRDWTISAIGRGRTGFPVDILTTEQPLGQSFDNIGRPDLLPGVPIWLSDPTVAGARRLNPAAFALPTPGTPGALGRNAIAGRGMIQADSALRREFLLPFGISAEVGLNIFNVLNHPNFADPIPFLSNPWFGQSVSMQNLMLGAGTPNSGLAPLFQTGGPRSGELTFRVSF